MDIKQTIVAVCVPFCLGQPKWPNSLTVGVVQNAGTKLSNTEEIVRLDRKEYALPNAFLGK
jgi:hypothetical protein